MTDLRPNALRRHRPARALGLVVALCLGAAGWLAMGPASAQDVAIPPRASLAAGSGAPGSTVLVIGEGWPASSVVQAQVCGNEALNGSADCLRSGAVTQGTDASGDWNAELPVDVPPTPCPCVVYVTGISGSTALRLPFDVAGVPSAAPVASASAVPVYRVSGVEVAGGSTFGSLMGGSSARTVSVTVQNSGAAIIPSLPVEARVGDGDHPATVAATQTVGPLAPNQSVTVELPITIPALSLGTSTVEAVIGSGAQTVSRSASVTTWPWLLFVLIALLVVGGVVAGAVLVARRRGRPLAQDVPGLPEPPVPPPGPPANDVIDLRTGQLILGAGAAAAGGAAPTRVPVEPAAPVPAPQVDAEALERDLADELDQVLAEAFASGSDGPADPVAIAAEVAAVVGARHRLGPAAVEALAAELRTALVEELGSVTSGMG